MIFIESKMWAPKKVSYTSFRPLSLLELGLEKTVVLNLNKYNLLLLCLYKCIL